MNGRIIFRQLYDIDSGTYTYIVADKLTNEGIIIDSTKNNLERDLKIISELNINLIYILDTHIHADHVTGAYDLKNKTNAKIVLGNGNKNIKNVDIYIRENEVLKIGDTTIKALLTPGHTSGCTTYQINNMLFTGDTLLIRSVGRTDFQNGNNEKLYESIKKLYSYEDETLIYPGHNYEGINNSTVSEEKKFNDFIQENTSKKEFIKKTNDRKMPMPNYINIAVPSNHISGEKIIKNENNQCENSIKEIKRRE